MTLDELRERVKPHIKEKRIPHVLGCEQEAVRLAARWGADETAAARAAILHDITKKCSLEEHRAIAERNKLNISDEEYENEKLLHARTGAALARELFCIDDETYEAIRWHTTGKPGMTLLEKIIYLADYIEPTRDFEGVEILRELAYENLDKCMCTGLKMSLDEIREKGRIPFKDTTEAFEYYAETR